jgi:Xaa-Pro aminopeptidase
MKAHFTFLFSVLITISSFTQNGLPTDYLSSDFHKSRREALRKNMEPNSVAVFFANPVRNRSNDVDFIYHQDPNFYYLTGFKEPHAVLIVFSENQMNTEGTAYNEILYVQEKDARAEMWTGYRLGTKGAKTELGFDMAFTGKEFKDSKIDYSKFDKVLFNKPHNDYRENYWTDGDLSSLISTFKQQVGYTSVYYNPGTKLYYEMIADGRMEKSLINEKELNNAFVEDIYRDSIIYKYREIKDPKIRLELKNNAIAILSEAEKSNIDTQSLSTLMAGLRQIKTKEELVLLTKAVRISAQGQREIMKAMHTGMSETEVQGVHEFVYKKYGTEYEGYPSIVGAGNNGCVLHYIENNKMKVENDLVLMDLGAEYHGYTADVTRTIPANGKFSIEQKLIYDLVYEAQEAGIKAAIIGNNFNAPDAAARQVITKGLIDLGIAKDDSEARQYFPHGTSHYLGLDVHDAGLYRNYEANMVITVEPGIYIPEGSDCDKKWWTIAVRIEDDILITENGPVNLSAEAPRTSEAIEALMKQKSVLDDFVLPKLD